MEGGEEYILVVEVKVEVAEEEKVVDMVSIKNIDDSVWLVAIGNYEEENIDNCTVMSLRRKRKVVFDRTTCYETEYFDSWQKYPTVVTRSYDSVNDTSHRLLLSH